VTRVADDGNRYRFVVNHGDESTSLGVDGVDLATGERVTSNSPVAGGGVRVIRL